MYSDWVWWLLILAVFVWLLILTFWFKNQVNFFKSLFPKGEERDIRIKFKELLQQVLDVKGDVGRFDSRLANFESAQIKHVQKVALKRYNPYQETGGDQSFSLALLDKEGDGFVLTSLHARAGTRVFAKPIKQGLSDVYQLSKEEQETIEEAMNFEIK
ncbi:hypothetical protein A3B45_05300 [Candidatus Daviesbacteria bacterium RIFCSPLOWO2_01_FULL_39_12]|uniref:DUF4446 domain-containing protein n=1 Tax=Candidatus Daviesbacteria bacterium RIFCSPLOWO2_01_FULL_39_12 TaxID=1797785 RepID=A0A1F5KQX3_9BACT|nr:MAG: hypothetical protein A3D79_02605 [Candidatus Daviesbacteria bacterium RIFCSPHIGHO2_02_FULL_39_8]OGE43021.1 MAG: hypothetical protein A3B45_05300 [Candidatus Daviesbacteria bacterium RIFCSPLOWO2_01_FULL_39_12]